MTTISRLIFCVFLLIWSSGAQEFDDLSDEIEKNPIEDQLKNLSLEVRQSKERENSLKIEVQRIDKVLKELKESVDEIKLKVNNTQQLSQLSSDVYSLKNEVNGINKILSEFTAKNNVVHVTDYQLCNHTLNVEKIKPDYTWTLSGMKQKMKEESRFQMESEVFPLQGYSMGAQVALTYVHGDLWCVLAFKNISNNDDDLFNLTLYPSVGYVFKNHSGQPHDDIIIRETFPHFNSSLQYDTYYYDIILLRSTYDISDSAVLNIYVETPEEAQFTCSYQGTVAMAIHDVKKKRALEKVENLLYQTSPYFYSGPRGYRMIVSINLHGTKNGMNASNPVISGPYDKDLPTSFNIRSTYTFLHPTDPTKNIVKSMVLKDTHTLYESVYVTNEVLETVLVNDTLFYHVTTELLEN